MSDTNEFLIERGDTIHNDLTDVYAGAPNFDVAAVRVAEYLDALAALVIEWAKTPGNHGGNPYGYEFVQRAADIDPPDATNGDSE